MKKTLKVLWKAMKLIFIVFFVFLGSLFFREQRLPGLMVDRLCDKFSTHDFLVSCDSVSVGFRYGIHLHGARLYDRTRRESLRPVFAVESLSFFPVSRRVRLVAAKLPRLHDGYYGITSNSVSSASNAVVGSLKFDLRVVELPRIPDFTLELVRPEILGIAPERVFARVHAESKKVGFEGLHLEWPDQDFRMSLDGFCTMDFGAQLLTGEVSGTARQEHIRPLLVALDLPCAYSYMGGYPDTGTSGFTEVPGPVPVSCNWRYDFAERDLKLDLGLHPDMGRYNNVRLQHVDGKLGVHAYYTDEYLGYDILVGPLDAVDLYGRHLQGWLNVHGTNNLDYLEFDAVSDLEKQDILDVIGYLNHGTFDLLECDAPPRVTARGVFNCDDVNIANNDFSGGFKVIQGRIFDQPVTDVSLDYRLKGSEIIVTNLCGHGFAGGDITGSFRFHLPLADDDESGCFGGGSLEAHDGKIVQVPLFLALTEALAENVPGVDKIVNQSESYCDFTISNGVFRTERLVVQGALFCIKLTGSCDLDSGELDFIAHCTVMKEESLLGKYLIQPVLWPFTKLLTQFHITGNKNKPVIRNTSIKSITEATGGLIKKVFN